MEKTNDSAAVLETQSANTRRRVIGKSEPVAVTTQEAIDGYREKARRIANVEQVELGNIMEFSIAGQLFRGEGQASMSRGLSLCKANGWNMKNHSHLKVARRLREKIHPMMLIVTIRKDEDRGICSATLRELWKIIKDQIKERTVAVVVVSKSSEMWMRTRMKSAASNWERDWQENIKKWRFQLGLSSKNLFHHKEHQVSGLTHGDDFVITGPTKRLMEFNKEMKKVYPTQEKIISFGSPESIKTLNRRLHWGKEGIVNQHDPRHVDVLVKELGLENGNTVQTPAAPMAAEEEESELLDQVQYHRYRSQVARCLFLIQDRADITFIENELCQTMSNPTQLSLAKLKRLTRYLKRERQWGQVFKYEKAVEEITMFTDSDWAGCKETRKSSSAGVVMSGAHALKAYTRKQKIIARSSAEAELYAAALGASELKGIISLMRDLGHDENKKNDKSDPIFRRDVTSISLLSSPLSPLMSTPQICFVSFVRRSEQRRSLYRRSRRVWPVLQAPKPSRRGPILPLLTSLLPHVTGDRQRRRLRHHVRRAKPQPHAVPCAAPAELRYCTAVSVSVSFSSFQSTPLVPFSFPPSHFPLPNPPPSPSPFALPFAHTPLPPLPLLALSLAPLPFCSRPFPFPFPFPLPLPLPLPYPPC